jgi:outer membrane protein TolC
LTEEQVAVSRASVERAQRTLTEVSRQVAQGVSPKFQRLSAQVEVANLETALLQAEVAQAAAKDNLKLLLGIPSDNEVRLRGSLEASMRPDYLVDGNDASAVTALSRRPDLKQAEIGIQLERIQLRVATSAFIPTVNAFANLNVLGNIPDNRFTYRSVDGDPFQFTSAELGYFDDAYWDRSTSVGLSLSWTLFNGLANHRRVQQRKIAVQKAENDVEFLTRSIRVEIDQNLRTLRAAHRRMQTQQQNLENARLNFEYAETRLREGVATPLEVREASDQLDQTQLNFLQAVHDVLVAQSTYEAAIGQPVRPVDAE